MNKTSLLRLQFTIISAFILLTSSAALSQTNAIPARVTEAVDIHNLVTLPGNIHPLARPEFDQGAAPDDLPMQRMLLVLKRSDAQEAALRQLLDDQQVKSSGRFHHWMTPEQFGQQFGPADADVQAVTGWLSSQGFQIGKISAGRTVIEFSGSAGLVRQALGAEIHRFHVNGSDYWANTGNPQIPAALAPVVSGFASLNNFPRHSSYHIVDTFSKSGQTGAVHPLFTVPTSSTANVYAVGPYDFATIYNVLPLWNAGIDGTGQTIAIVGETNINPVDVFSFRDNFGLPSNNAQIILNGTDPGIVPGDETEALIDVEWSGAVAKGATIDLVVSQTTEATLGVDLSALYIVDNDLAPVMSESYGECEQDLGVAGNAFEYFVREQAAAEGITYINSSGDGGSARCDQGQPEYAATAGLAISGLASTPFNVAVGGTDFADNNNWTPYWSATNGSNYASAKSYIPETTWNSTCAASGQAGNCADAGSATPEGINLVAGGGGPSTCGLWTGTGQSAACASGYPKPAWQSGTGVPNDGVRDIPDVSLFASTGTNGSFYVLCEADAVIPNPSCSGGADWYFIGVGGTSVAAPNFAGMMALVNQKTGERQGNANYTLYPLAASSGAQCTSNSGAVTKSNCIFYDVVSGNNSVACVGGSKNCSNSSPTGYGILESGGTPAWLSGAGYDVATGLGSLNAANLVNKWTTVSFLPTTTTLSALPGTVAHGQSVSFTLNVASTSGTPTGDVSLLAEGIGPTPTIIGTFTLAGGGTFSGATTGFPGGSYNVVAHYAGDGTHGASDSSPQAVNGQPGNSEIWVTLISCNYTSGACTPGTTSLVYGASQEILRMNVTDSSGNPCISGTTGLPAYLCPTGAVMPLVNGLDPPVLNEPSDFLNEINTLNSQGYSEDQYIELPGGTSSITASYLGDKTYNASSTTAAYAATVTPAPVTITLSPVGPSITENFGLSANITTQSHGFAPGGTVQFLSDNTPIGAPVTLMAQAAYSTLTGNYASASASTSGVIAPVGTHSLTAQYLGDGNYAASTSAPVSVTVTDFSLTANSTTLTLSNASPTASTSLSLAPLGGFTGLVYVDLETYPQGTSCTVSPGSVTFTNSSPATATLTCQLTATVVSQTPPAPPATPIEPSRPAKPWRWVLIGGLLLALLTIEFRLVRRRAGWILATASLVAAILVACGGGGRGGAIGPSTPSGPPAVSLSATGLTFAQQAPNTTGASQVLTITNTGSGPLTFSGTPISGAAASDFSQSGNCSTVEPNSPCRIYIQFMPQAPGLRSAALNLQDNASGSPQQVSLTGTGGPGAIVSLSPSSIDFGLVAINTTAPSQTVTLSNVGNAPLANPSFTFNAGNYGAAYGCANNLAPGMSCPLIISFAPQQTGAQNEPMMVTYAGYSSPQSMLVKGAGGISSGTFSILVYAEVANGNANHHVPITLNVQ